MSAADIKRIADTIPELKDARIARYTEKLGLPDYDARVLTEDKDVSDLFDGVVKLGADAKKASNFIMSEVLRLAKSQSSEDVELKVSAEQLAEILKMSAADELNNLAAKQLLSFVWGTNDAPRAIAAEKGLLQSNDEGEIKAVFDRVVADNPKQTADFIAGNDKLRGYFVGQIMRASGGKANPKIINSLLDKLKS